VQYWINQLRISAKIALSPSRKPIDGPSNLAEKNPASHDHLAVPLDDSPTPVSLFSF
jgi:hypothetical protein